MSDGSLLVPQAQVVLRETAHCSPRVATEVELRVLRGDPEALRDWAAGRLRARVAAEVPTVEAELEPQVTEQRLRDARDERRVSVRPEPDGMGSPWALLPAEQLRTFALGLDELARRQERSSGSARRRARRPPPC
ncbi:MAG: hypothetical protein M3P46_06460 [Actinomycetota bacterium]|nr:hypothetical protein [Actinomycetota bacterium]